jgi:hypothetical protein
MIPVKYINQVPVGTVRAIAAQVFVLTLLGIYYNQPWIVLFITFDFALRLSNKAKFSLLAQLSNRFLVPWLKLSHVPTGLKPKRFAAGIGLLMTMISLVFYIRGSLVMANSILGILAFFAFLEGFLGFCAGCKIYALLTKAGVIKDPECEECVIDK